MKIFFSVINGVEGPSLAYGKTKGCMRRISGPKPWGGGSILHEFEVDGEVMRDLGPTQREAELEDQLASMRLEIDETMSKTSRAFSEVSSKCDTLRERVKELEPHVVNIARVLSCQENEVGFSVGKLIGESVTLREDLLTAQALVSSYERGDQMLLEMVAPHATIAEGIEELKEEVKQLEAAWRISRSDLQHEHSRLIKERARSAERYDCHAGPGTTQPACGACLTCVMRERDEAREKVKELEAHLETRVSRITELERCHEIWADQIVRTTQTEKDRDRLKALVGEFVSASELSSKALSTRECRCDPNCIGTACDRCYSILVISSALAKAREVK